MSLMSSITDQILMASHDMMHVLIANLALEKIIEIKDGHLWNDFSTQFPDYSPTSKNLPGRLKLRLAFLCTLSRSQYTLRGTIVTWARGT